MADSKGVSQKGKRMIAGLETHLVGHIVSHVIGGMVAMIGTCRESISCTGAGYVRHLVLALNARGRV